MSKVVKLARKRICAWCSSDAEYDFKTTSGQWGYGCETHYTVFRMFSELGTGKGQKIEVDPS